MSAKPPPSCPSTQMPIAPRVLLWTDSDQFAGTERHLAELEKGLRRIGVPVMLACPPDTPLARTVLENGGTIRPLSSRGAHALTAVWRLRRWISCGEVNILHAHNGRTALLGAIACERLSPGRLIASLHFIHPARTARQGWRKNLSQRMHAWLNSRVDAWICVSEAVRLAAEKRGDIQGTPAFTVRNGLDERVSERFENRPELDPERVNLVCVARLAPEKGHVTLLEAFADLGEQARGLTSLHLVGDGPLRAGLEARTRELGLEQSVRFWGHQPRAEPWIAASDALILASPEEPFGMVLLEAMRESKPVIAARAGGAREIVAEERSGLLFRPGDVGDLARQIGRLAADSGLRWSLGQAGRERWLTNFSLGAMSERVASIYRGMGSRSPSRRIGSSVLGRPWVSGSGGGVA
jgi:glycosyltransferase involved in cell wall biosynthesis